VLHPPYTAWHVAYAVIGAALAPRVNWLVLGATALAFFLAVGLAAHALDELRGRPLQTRIPSGTLVALAAVSIVGACAIGLAVAVQRDLWLLVFVALGGFLVVAYNLELAGGAFHGDLWFAVGWGAFPLLTAYFASASELRLEAFVAAAFAALLSLAQRILSTPVRDVRRRVASVSGHVDWRDGRQTPLDAEALTRAPERALRALTAAVILLAVALVLVRVT
jgi:hypothetical protein